MSVNTVGFGVPKAWGLGHWPHVVARQRRQHHRRLQTRQR